VGATRRALSAASHSAALANVSASGRFLDRCESISPPVCRRQSWQGLGALSLSNRTQSRSYDGNLFRRGCKEFPRRDILAQGVNTRVTA